MHRVDRPALLAILPPGLAAAAAAAAATAASASPGVAALAAGIAAAAAALALGATRAPRRQTTSTAAEKAAPGLPAGAGRNLLESLPLGVILIDDTGTVQFMNRAAEGLLGRRPPGDFPMAALRAPRLLEGIETARRDRQPVTAEFTLARTSDTFLHARIHPLEPDAADRPPSILVALEDHSRAHRAAELHRDFVANASHELKTPLAAISGLVETLQGHAREDPQARDRFLTMIGAQADRMRRLVEDLLSLNRIEINERLRPRDPQPLGPIVAEVADSLRAEAAEAKMELKLTGLDRAPTVAGNREELAQAIANLVENAVRYGTPRTAIDLSVVTDPAARPGMVGIAVADRGPGIPREEIPRLTERFYRVSAARSREKGGTGLGLAIVKHIVNRHRGALEIESTVGQGSRFTIWLPALAGESVRESRRKAAS